MADIFLTLEQIEDLFISVIKPILGYSPLPTVDPDKVRACWPSEGAPAWKRTEDVAFLRIFDTDDSYNRQRDQVVEPKDADNANQITSYTRVLEAFVTLYGPHSFDRAFQIRNQMYYPQYREMLAVQKVFLIPDVASPRRAPELYAGQWWERTDVSLRFNARVLFNVTVPYLKSATATVDNVSSTTGIAVAPKP